MITTHTQRWRARRDSYRPAGEPLRTADYEVAPIASDTVAKAFVLEHHYSGCYPAARYRFGLYRQATLVGVAVFSQPMSAGVLRELPGDPRDSVELGRFACSIRAAGTALTLHRATVEVFVDRDWVPANNAQAEDRAHRIGTDHVVTVEDLVSDHPIDRHVTEVLVRKSRLIAATFSLVER